MRNIKLGNAKSGVITGGVLERDFGVLGRLLIMPGLAQLVSADGAIMNFLHPTENQINNIIKFLSK